MTNESKRKIEREDMEGIVRSYLGSRGYFNNRGEYELAGVSRLDYLHSFGVTEHNKIDFLKKLRNFKDNIMDEVKLLGVSVEDVPQGNSRKSIENVDIVLPNEDIVILRGYEDSGFDQKGKFVTGFNSETKTFGFASDRDYSHHKNIAEEYLPDHKIFEAGFADIARPFSYIRLYGKSEGFGVIPGEVSRTLLERALNGWRIE